MTHPVRWLVFALALAACASIARAALRVQRGLSAEYFANPGWNGAPAFSALDEEISAARIGERFQGAPPEQFSVRWSGYLVVPDAGVYRFATLSDDGSRVFLDGRLVVENGGTHGEREQFGEVRLDAGPHFVLIDYFQDGGAFALEWRWSGEARTRAPVPGWLLSPRRITYRAAVAARALESIAGAALCVAVLFAVSIVSPHVRRRAGSAASERPRLATFALFAALAIVHTWPLASDPAHLSRNENGDTVLTEWIVAWVIHQAPRDPWHLFDANIFYPERNTLAYSESMLVQSAMGAPLRLAGASPVLTYNILLIGGFALTGWAMCLVLFRWTGDWLAAITGGILMGFNAHTLTRMPHLQAQHVEFLPLALFAFDRLLVVPRARHAASFAAWFALQALASFYLFVLTSVALAAAMLARPSAWKGKRASHLVAGLATAGGLAAVVLLPYLLPYWRLSHGGFTRPIGEVAGFAATWRNYLTTPGRMPRMVIAKWASGNALYPGATGVLLAATALGSGVALRDPRARMCLAFGLAGLVLSFGPDVPGYEWLYHLFPPLQGIRAVWRFGYLAIVSVAVLAAYGLAWLRQTFCGRPWVGPLSAACVCLAALEPLAAPIGYTRFAGIPNIYTRVAAEPHAVVVELPLPLPRGSFFNAPFMMNSTVHWKPLVNGYSGFLPVSYSQHYEQLRSFPAADAIAALRQIGVTHAFVHRNQLSADERAALDTVTGLLKIAEEGPIVLYFVLSAPARP